MDGEFYRRVGIVCRHIPEGRVATYGQIALGATTRSTSSSTGNR